jgi:hypothetical protein
MRKDYLITKAVRAGLCHLNVTAWHSSVLSEIFRTHITVTVMMHRLSPWHAAAGLQIQAWILSGPQKNNGFPCPPPGLLEIFTTVLFTKLFVRPLNVTVKDDLVFAKFSVHIAPVFVGPTRIQVRSSLKVCV